MSSRNTSLYRTLYHVTLWGAVTAGALVLAVGLGSDPVPALPLLLLFLGLGLVTESGHLTLPYAGYVSFGAVAALPAILVVGPGYASLFGALGQLVSNLRRRRPIGNVLFNPGQKAFCIAAAAAAWNLVGTGRLSLGPVHPAMYPEAVLAAALVCVAVYTIATHIVVSLFSAARGRLPLGSVLIGNAPMRVGAAMALGSFGLVVGLLALRVRTNPPNLEYALILVLFAGLGVLDWDFHRQTSRVQRAAFERGLERAIGHRTALSVVNVSINATAQRADGGVQDEALRDVARLLTLEYRAHVDVVSRRGTTELVALLPQTGRAQASVLANRIRQTVERITPASEAGESASLAEARLTVRVGIASYPEDGGTVEALIRAADRSMRALGASAAPGALRATP
jgi:diguanylate cyclase (GGDEF)-like protein